MKREDVAKGLCKVLEGLGYQIENKGTYTIEARKKRTLQLVVGSDWNFDTFEQAIAELSQIRAPEAYCAVVLPNTDTGTGCMQPVEVVKKYYKYCNDKDINIWGLNPETGGLYLATGNMPKFDFKLLSNLMSSNTTMMGVGAQKSMQKFAQNKLE